MIGSILESQSEFGVVLAAKDGIARIGCTAAVEQVLQRYEDGRLDILTVGRRRFIIQTLDQEKDYLRAEVEYFDDEEFDAPGELRQRALRVCEVLPSEEDNSPNSEDPLLSFRLAQRVEDVDFRQQLLMNRSEPDRLRRIIQFAPGYADQQKRVAHMKEIAPQNGHGRLPGGGKEM
jgi:hypothetical protein